LKSVGIHREYVLHWRSMRGCVLYILVDWHYQR